MSIRDVFSSLDPSVPSITLCSRNDGNLITVMAYKPADKPWVNLEAPQEALSSQEFYVLCDKSAIAMASFPVLIAGYSYQTFVNLNADNPFNLSTGETGRLLKIIADAHDRTFFVAPDSNMQMLLSHIPHECDLATIICSIEFKERRYTVLAWRCSTGSGVEKFVVDPAAFDSALRLSGWRQIDPPSHQDGKKYHVMIARNNDGPRYSLTDRTDLQAYKTREESLVNHFVLQLA